MEIIKFAAVVLWLYPLVNGEKQRIIIIPTYNLFGDVHKYTCKFYENKECLWQLNNATITLTSISYRYLKENNHCSIVAKNNKIAEQNNIECVVYANQPLLINTELNKTITLYCYTSTLASCAWYRNEDIVQSSGRYKYLNAKGLRNCSLVIYMTTSTDNGNWQCVSQSTDNQNSDTFTKYALTVSAASVNKISKQSTNDNSETTNTASPTPVSPSGANNATQNGLIIGLCIVCLIIVLLTSTTFCLFKRQKTLKNAISTLQVYANEPTENVDGDHIMKSIDEENIYENIPQITRTANETQPEIHPPPRNIFIPNPNNVLETEEKSTEVIYTQVVVTKRMSYFGPPVVPHCDVDQVTYATITHKKINQDSVKR